MSIIIFPAKKSDQRGLVQEMVDVCITYLETENRTKGPYTVRVSKYGAGFTKLARRNKRKVTDGVGYIDYSQCWVVDETGNITKVAQTVKEFTIRDEDGNGIVISRESLANL